MYGALNFENSKSGKKAYSLIRKKKQFLRELVEHKNLKLDKVISDETKNCVIKPGSVRS